MTNTALFANALTLREDAPAPGVAASLEGIAVPYGDQITVGRVRESFAREAFDPAEVIGKPLCWRHDEPIGRVVDAVNTDEGLMVRAEIADTTLGRDAATLLRTGSVRGLSVGFQPLQDAWNEARDAVTRVKAALGELSLTHMPAYAAAGVSTIREEAPMTETATVETPEVSAPDYATREEVDSLRERLASINVATPAAPTHPLSEFRSFGDYAKAVMDGTIESRALTDHALTDEPGIVPPNWLTAVQKVVSFGRPVISALGTESAGSSGMEFNWPYLDTDLSTLVAEQALENDEVESVLVEIKKASASLKTYAGGGSMSFQLLQRSNPAFLSNYLRYLAIGYAIKTDSVFGAALVTASTPFDYDLAADTDGADFRAAIFGASVEVENATGMPANVVLVASDAFTTMGEWSTLYPAGYGTYNVAGTADAGSLNVNISGLRIRHARNLANGSIIVTNDSCAKWIEDGPRVVDQTVVSTLSQQAAIYGYGTSAVYNAAGVISLESVGN